MNPRRVSTKARETNVVTNTEPGPGAQLQADGVAPPKPSRGRASVIERHAVSGLLVILFVGFSI